MAAAFRRRSTQPQTLGSQSVPGLARRAEPRCAPACDQVTAESKFVDLGADSLDTVRAQRRPIAHRLSLHASGWLAPRAPRALRLLGRRRALRRQLRRAPPRARAASARGPACRPTRKKRKRESDSDAAAAAVPPPG